MKLQGIVNVPTLKMYLMNPLDLMKGVISTAKSSFLKKTVNLWIGRSITTLNQIIFVKNYVVFASMRREIVVVIKIKISLFLLKVQC